MRFPEYDCSLPAAKEKELNQLLCLLHVGPVILELCCPPGSVHIRFQIDSSGLLRVIAQMRSECGLKVETVRIR
jgi:hypothetical protein